jgi:hypothetical protein
MPCFETDPDHCCGKPFFDTISVEMVLDALRGVVRWAERGE